MLFLSSGLPGACGVCGPHILWIEMKKTVYLLLVPVLAFAAAVSSASPLPERSAPPDLEEQARLRKHLWHCLSEASTPVDSLKIYYDIFDLGPESETCSLIFPIHDIAVRVGDENAELDMLRQCAVNYIDSADRMERCLALAEAKVKALPGDDLAKETLLFIRMMCAVRGMGHGVAIDAPVEGRINNLIARYISNPPTDPYEKFEILFSICAYMGNLGEGQALESYVEKLGEAMAELPLSTGHVGNAVFSRNSVSFTNFGLFRQALDCDRRLLVLLDSIEDRYHQGGRTYRRLDGSRFKIYRRMLANAAGLRRPEIDRIWNSIGEIASRNSDVAADMDSDSRTEIYYLMATEQYDRAAPMILDRVLNNTRPMPFREVIYNALITAAEKTGDKDVLLKSYRVYSDMLLQRLKNRQAESIRELSIAYSVNDLKEENVSIQQELSRRQLTITRLVSFCAMLVALLLATTAFVLWRQKKRAAASAATIERINASLVAERDKLERMQAELIAARDEAKESDRLKTDFINNTSHEIIAPLDAIAECSQLIVDCIPEEKRPFLEKFGRKVEQNVAFVQRLVNDMLDAATLESRQPEIARMAVSVMDICNFAIDSISGELPPGVSLVFQPSDEVRHTLMVTDRQRVSQVLINLLGNAAKFTERGTVTLSVIPDKASGTIAFAVSDTGIGIRKGKEEVIFERFRQLDTSVRGCGLGLYISRLIARLLGGDVTVDTSYRGGARFVLTLPLTE